MTASFKTVEQRLDKIETDLMILTSKIDAAAREQTYIMNQAKILSKLGDE